MLRWFTTIMIASTLSTVVLHAQNYSAQQPLGASAQQRPAYLAQAGIEQRLGAQLPLNAIFTDESGKTGQLKQWMHNRPVVLAEVYYRCVILCPTVLHDLAAGLKQISLVPGRDYDVLIFSIDPMDQPRDAASEKNTFVQEAGFNTDGANAVHFLTAQQSSIDAITQATGFHYVRIPGPDGKMDQFAHATVILFATPEGRISKYLTGLNYPPGDLRLALLDASRKRISNPVDLIILYCCNYSPSTGRYTLSVLRVVSVAGLATILAMVGMFCFLWCRPARSAKG